MMAAALSRRLGWIDDATVERIERIHQRAGLPVFGPALEVERYLVRMAGDKKVEDGRLRLILLRDIGEAVIHGGGARGYRCRDCGTLRMMTTLAPYAVSDASSRGRRYAEPAPGIRSEFQRDRDRIVHSTAFRRLEYKTQVFVNHEGDLFRTRLTHSIEVAQICRSIARTLSLNEDLAEAIALAHDLGHTPFGHAGQDALNKCMKDHGGFEHNLQSLRTVELLEEHYAAFDGLNLIFETREGF